MRQEYLDRAADRINKKKMRESRKALPLFLCSFIIYIVDACMNLNTQDVHVQILPGAHNVFTNIGHILASCRYHSTR